MRVFVFVCVKHIQHLAADKLFEAINKKSSVKNSPDQIEHTTARLYQITHRNDSLDVLKRAKFSVGITYNFALGDRISVYVLELMRYIAVYQYIFRCVIMI